MTDTITLHDIEVWAHHGVLTEERERGQPFIITVTAHLDLAVAAASDELADTVDYSILAREVADAAAAPPSQLLEVVAQRVADVVLSHDAVASVEVTIVKPHAPMPVPVGAVSVTVHRARGG